MDLAWVTGHGPRRLTDIEGRGPLVRPEGTVTFAYRDHEDQKEFGSQPMPAKLKVLDLPTDELGAALRIALASGKPVGIEITIYNPHLDHDGSAGRGLVDVRAVGTTAR